MKKALTESKVLFTTQFISTPGRIDNKITAFSAFGIKDVEDAVKQLKKELWKHPGRFEGIKGKTCLPLDWVESLINQQFPVFANEVKK